MEPFAFDLPAYLKRVGLDVGPPPGVETLTALHEAHLGTIPFENLDILLGRPIDLGLPALQAKLVTQHRGGYCFEQNTLFRTALESLGYAVTALAARVRAGSSVLRPRTHMLLRIDLDAGPYLADVGFGADGFVHPLRLENGVEGWCGSTGHRLQEEEGLWVLQGNLAGEWMDLYAFTLEPHFPVDFEMANHFTSTYPRSPFVQTLTAQRSWPDGGVILRDRILTLREGSTSRTLWVQDPEHLLEMLAQHFGLSFPAGTRFSRPAF
jgi:N-hydroxyarylamine O-acetyltransferase